jgi:hypothetical protein
MAAVFHPAVSIVARGNRNHDAVQPIRCLDAELMMNLMDPAVTEQVTNVRQDYMIFKINMQILSIM